MSRPAHADTPRSAVCTAAIIPEKVPAVVSLSKQSEIFATPMADWMNQQLAAGRTEFVLSPASSIGMALCAW